VKEADRLERQPFLKSQTKSDGYGLKTKSG
jgi:hypothetical protein